MSTSTSAIFSGNSRYSSDFQAVINRAVAIASLPITALNTEKTALSNQTTALNDLGTKFSALKSAVDGISSALGGSSFEASVSDPSKVSVTLGDGALEGNYSIEVLDAGACATSLSQASWTTDTATHNYQLSLGGQTYGIATADHSAAGVAAAINTQYGDKVRATVVNVGTSGQPDYRLSLQATALGDLKPDILDNGASLQSQQTQGVQAHYVVNGSGRDVYSSSRSVAVATGITFNLLASSAGTPTNITVTRSTSALSSALSAFADAYNAAATALDQQRGENAGPLSGQTIVTDLQEVLRGIATYTSSGGLGSLTSLGLELGVSGQITFNSFTLIGADLGNSSGVTAFLGNSSSGFLNAATDAMNSVEDTTTGLLPTAQGAITSQSSRLDQSIADQQTRVDSMQTQLQQQISSADALIAGMEQQYNYLYGLFSAMQTANQQYK